MRETAVARGGLMVAITSTAFHVFVVVVAHLSPFLRSARHPINTLVSNCTFISRHILRVQWENLPLLVLLSAS